MMAHESPEPVPNSNKNNSSRKREKATKVSDPGTLPNGKPVNFGTKGSEGSKKGRKSQKLDTVPGQSLPSGEKPRFSTDAKPRKKLPKEASGKDKSTADGRKGKKEAAGAGKLEDTYAGSSFHSSPAALNLPKPSFSSTGSAPPPQVAGPVPPPQVAGRPQPANAGNPVPMRQMGPVGPMGQPGLTGQPAPGMQTVSVPGFSNGMHGRPGMGPPLGATVPPGQLNMYGQPGFSYSVSPQGYINYQYPPFVAHHPPYPMAATPAPMATPAQPGQKITFDQLLGQQ